MATRLHRLPGHPLAAARLRSERFHPGLSEAAGGGGLPKALGADL